MEHKPTIAIVGPGRAGSTLARALLASGYHIAAVAGRHPEHVQELAAEVTARPVQTAADAVRLAQLTILAVPDDSILAVAAELAEAAASALKGRSVVHLSGARDRAPLAALSGRGAQTGVWHPLQTFTKARDAVRNIPGSLFGVDADPPLRDTLTRMVEELHGEAFDLRGVDRSLYHAAAVLVANYSITLQAEATALMEEAGLDRQTAYRGLTRLLLGSAMNSLKVEQPQDALTGPAARGDTETVKRHVEALSSDPQLRDLYQTLAARTIRLARHQTPPSDHDAAGGKLGGLHHVQLAMPPGQESRAEDFYARILGLQPMPKPQHLRARGGCWFSDGEVEVHLGVEESFKPALKAHPAFLVRELDGLRSRLNAAGVEVAYDTQLNGHNRFYVSDPFGNRLEFIEENMQLEAK
jgi:predicted short-subunit dehydrogenase-like oxidoreductase (DUF2520 family)/catechol 2,3-dioxygenase-like lactoylglutathione lyase family enzyme